MRRITGGLAFAGLVAAVVGAQPADARPRRHRHPPRAAPLPEPEFVEKVPVVVPQPDGLGSLAANLAASSYNNPFYGYGSYYAPAAGVAVEPPGYGYSGY